MEPNLAPVVLARVDSVEITDLDFEEALESLAGERPPAATLKECRKKLQLLIDRQLLLLEVKKEGFYEDPEVMRQVEQWEREQLVLALQETETGVSTSQWEEEELREFFSGAGATRELRVGRLVFADSVRAARALDDARRGLPFAELTTLHTDGADAYVNDSGWLNLLALADRRLVSLFARWGGDAELITAGGKYLVLVILEERIVTLDERRNLAIKSLENDKANEAHLAYLKTLMKKYDVYLDDSGVASLNGIAPANAMETPARLVRSSLGEWTTAQYRSALQRQGLTAQDAPAPGRDRDLHDLGVYALDELVLREADQKGLRARLARRREKVREQKAIEALWARVGLSQIPVAESEIRAYFEGDPQRYAEDLRRRGGAGLVRAKIIDDLREERAAPLFETYLEKLRDQYRPRVRVEEDRFRAFVAGIRQATAAEFEDQSEWQVVCIQDSQKELMEEHRFGGSMRLGAYAAVLKRNTRVLELYEESGRLEEDQRRVELLLDSEEAFRIGQIMPGRDKAVLERHRHRYEISPRFVDLLQEEGLVFSGYHRRVDGTQLMEFLELPGHRFFIATQAHPEFKSRMDTPAPLFSGFVGTALAYQHERRAAGEQAAAS